jgi:squalene-associated FAD-dependent desaturase
MPSAFATVRVSAHDEAHPACTCGAGTGGLRHPRRRGRAGAGSTSKADVLIIGGGLAGLAAGVSLASRGARVTLLEARPQLGGRASSFVERVTGDVVDNGQHLMMGCYHHTLRFLERIGSLDLVRMQPSLHIDFLEPGRPPMALHCPALPTPWGLLAGLGWLPGLSAIDKLAMLRVGLDLLAGGGKPDPPWAGLTVDAWLSSLGQGVAARRVFWDPLTLATLNEAPTRAGASYLVTVLRQALLAGPDASRLVLPQVGLSQLYTEQARSSIEASGGKVCLETVASRLLIADDAVSGVELRGGDVLQARAYISAVPHDMLARLLSPAPGVLAPLLCQLNHLEPSPIISINLWLDRDVTKLEFASLLGTRVQWLFNKRSILRGRRGGISAASPDATGGGTERKGDYLALTISGARDLMNWQPGALVEMAVGELRDVLPAMREAAVRHARVVKERRATISPFVGSEACRPSQRTPLANLFLAGDWTDTGLPATMESAVRSGHACAELI